MAPILLALLVAVAVFGLGLFALASIWLSPGWAAFVAVALVIAAIVFVVSFIRRRIRMMLANPSLAGLVRSGGTAAVLALILRNPKLLFSLGSLYMTMRRNQRGR